MAWRIDENGEPDDMPVADPMGPVSRWQELGEDVAGSLWVKTLAEITRLTRFSISVGV